MILNISFIISAYIRKVSCIFQAVIDHDPYKLRCAFIAVCNTYYHTIALTDPFLLQHGGRIYIKDITRIVGKCYKMQPDHADTAGRLPFDGGQLGPD